MTYYLYKTILYKSGTVVIGAPASNGTDLTDFETNFKATAITVNEIVLAETTVIIIKTYTQFKALIDGVLITWADIKYIETGMYELNLLSGTPL